MESARVTAACRCGRCSCRWARTSRWWSSFARVRRDDAGWRRGVL